MPPKDRRDVNIAIAGAGFSGLGMAIALRREGIQDFVVLERADDLGGTWRDNIYPGCACDIASVLYSYSDEQNPGWTQAFAGQPEIWAYIREVARRHDVASHMRYGHELLSAVWDDEADLWELETSQGDFTAEILLSATGALADPAIPDLPGLGRFGGTVFHSARWDHDHDLAGRRVAVVGTGASAIQFVPEIQPQVGHLDLFQRTPPWVLPRGNPAIPATWRRRLARHPKLLSGVRRSVFSLYESFHYGFKHPAVMKLVERRARAHIAKQVSDPELRSKLTPDYRLGCKRVLGSNIWYPALCQDNVDVVSTGITEVTEDGIVDADGVHHAVDTIIFGTGFQVTDMPIGRRIRGRAGERLADRWEGSPQAHLGVAVAGYPNLFLLLGPNTGLGHNSVLLMIEAQIVYLSQALRYRREHGLSTLEPIAEVQDAFVAELDRGTAGSVWTAGGCLSWYVDKTGRNSTLWPGSVRDYQRRLARFEIGDYSSELPRPVPTREPELIADGSVEDDEWVEEINFGGVVNGVRAFLPILLRQNSGVIVNTSSVFGLVGIPYQSAYCASKFAVRGFTESLRHELRGTGVRAVTVHPGGVKTNIARNARYHAHPLHRDVSHDEASRQFDAMARTTPVRAAKIIHEGVVAGRSRILVGPDAYLFDVLARLAPTRYFDVLAVLEPLAVRLN